MKILMLTPYLPYPLLTGGQTRSYNLIKRLSQLGHEITLFCLIKNDKEKENVSKLEEFCKEVRVFNRPTKPWTVNNIVRTGLSVFPFLVVRNWAPGEKKAVENKLKDEQFDLIHAETFYVMPHIPKTSIPIVLVDQTIEYEVYQHYVDSSRWLPIKPLMYLDVAKLKYWELKYWRQASKVVAMSEEDKKIMLKQIPNLDVDIVPNGVDFEYFQKKISSLSDEPVILYLGNFTWLQNREAVDVLYRKVWPKIKAKVENAKLWIIGKEADRFFGRIKDEQGSLSGENVRVEEVKDVRKAYQGAWVLVAPIYGAGGTRYKNFEAFASGLPVVTTSIGIGGTEAVDGKELIIRDDPDEIAEATVELIKDKGFAKKIADSARKMVKEKYDWDPIAKHLSEIYMSLKR